MPILLITTLIIGISFSLTTYAEEKLPYEYTFVKDPIHQFNGINGVKKIVMTFNDRNLSTTDIKMGSNVYVVEGGQTIQEGEKVPDELKIDILNPIVVSGNKIEITFKNLEYLDYSLGANLDYQLVIEKNANLHFDQLGNYVLPFKIYEVLPGFESIFVKSTKETINNRILKNNPSRDVQIHVPKIYLTEIITSHRYKGVLDPELESHALTNIDVKADPEATRMTVAINNDEQHARDLDYRSDVGGFSMTQAGLEALICAGEEADCTGSAQDIQLTAYDQFGKYLTQRNFKLKVANNEKDFTRNDYLKKPDKIFGQQTTLEQLILDPKLLESIVTQIPVSEIDQLGVTYSLGSKIEVANSNQFTMALKNPSFKTLIQTEDIIGDIFIDRPLTIDSSDRAIVGKVTLGDGNSIIVRMKDSRITEELSVNIGDSGAAILENVIVDETVSINGKSKSIHMFNISTSNEIELNHESDIRIVNVGATPDFKVKSDEMAELVGTYGTVSIDTPDAQLTLTNSTDIEELVLNGNNLTITKPQNKALPYRNPNDLGELKVIDTDPILGEGGKTIHEVYYPEVLSESASVWEALGQHFTVSRFPYGIEWEVVNPKVFGGQSKVMVENQRINIIDVTNEQTQEVVLQGILDGEIYRVTIFIEVTLE